MEELQALGGGLAVLELWVEVSRSMYGTSWTWRIR